MEPLWYSTYTNSTQGPLQQSMMTYFNVCIHKVFTSSTVSPFTAADLFNLRWLPVGFDSLRMVPHEDEAIPFQTNVWLHPRHIRN